MIDHDSYRLVVQNDLATFVRKAFRAVWPGTPYLDSPHIHAIVEALMAVERGEERRLIINQPPRSLKSFIVSVAYVAWLLGKDPSRRIIVVSYSADLAALFHRHFRTVVESDWYRELFPAMKIMRVTDAELVTTANGGRWAISTGGTLTGRGADLIIVDDPMKAEDGRSEPARKKVAEWYSGTLISRLNEKARGAIIVVMQRLHEDDLSGHLLRQGGWRHLSLPAIATEDEEIPIGYGRVYKRRVGDVLQPEREDRATLDALKAEMREAFQAQYQQAPVPPDGNMIKRDWVPIVGAMPERGPGSIIVQSWDVATTTGERNDWSVCTTALVDELGVCIFDVVRARWQFHELREQVESLGLLFNADRVLVEEAGPGLSLLQDLWADARLKIPRPEGRKPVGSKVDRMAAQSSRFAGGQVSILGGRPWLDELLAELLGFPNTRHDDQVDSISQLLGWWWEWRRDAGPYVIGAPILIRRDDWEQSFHYSSEPVFPRRS